ncbi:hypothetical protein GBA52_024554 [Prunus armeniaca]|nr:hypothetical protein GBA52_024554 [Prunus armeniaca]
MVADFSEGLPRTTTGAADAKPKSKRWWLKTGDETKSLAKGERHHNKGEARIVEMEEMEGGQ